MNVAFTIVLNGMPFIEQQYNIIPKFFDKWYIIEGATKPTNCTGWCRNIPEKYINENKCSTDGTFEFLNKIQNDKIRIIRKHDFWNGKLEMCNSFMNEIEHCTLMQIDVDEFWNGDILTDIFCYNNEHKNNYDCMLFRCNYYVGPDIKIITENGYADARYEWCRLLNIKNKTSWMSHEPPRMHGCPKALGKEFTSKTKNWIFDHYAYTTKEQLQFKEDFYGYTGAVKQWELLQQNTKFPCNLSNYLKWVRPSVLVDRIK